MRSYLKAPFKINTRVIFDYELIFIDKGSFIITIDKDKLICKENDIILIPPGVAHSIESIDNTDVSQPHIHFDMQYDLYSENIYVSYKNFPDFGNDEKKMIRRNILKGIVNDYFIHIDNLNEFKKIFFYTIDTFDKADELYELKYKASMCELIMMILKNNAKISEKPKNDTIMLIKEYLDHNFHNRITLDTLEKQFHYNRFYIEKKFKELYKTPVKKYYSELRLNAVKKDLKSGYNVTEITEKYNFGSIYTLSRFFKNYTGISPRQYIKNM